MSIAETSTGAEPILTLTNVRKSYARQRVLDIGTLTFSKGDCVVLAGANGSGKSTLLRLIAGISIADSGTIRRSRTLSSMMIGYVPQAGGLYGDVSLAENFRWRRRLFGLAATDFTVAPESHFEKLGLVPLLNRKFADLSGGYQRLAAVAAAFDVKPEWLLLDEPFSGMDERKRAEVEALIQDARAWLDLVIVTAPAQEHFTFSTSRLLLHEGRLQ